MCHQNYFKLSGTFYTGVILILYRANIRFYVPPGGNLNFSLISIGSRGAQNIFTISGKILSPHFDTTFICSWQCRRYQNDLHFKLFGVILLEWPLSLGVMVRLDACSRFWWREAAPHWPEVRPTPPRRRPIGGGPQQGDHWTVAHRSQWVLVAGRGKLLSFGPQTWI